MDYRRAGVRLMEETRKELQEAAYPGPGMKVDGLYARRMQQLEAVHLFDLAHATMLARQGIISRATAAAILDALLKMEENSDIRELRYQAGGGIHSGERHLSSLLGKEVSGALHTGRSSGDLNEVSCRITLRERMLKIDEQILLLIETLLNLSEEHIPTLMPGYTQLMHAQPTTFGHYLLSWVCAFERDLERSRDLFKRVNRSPAGSAIMAGSDFPIDRRYTAELLGFDAICENTRDAIWNREYLVEAAGWLSILANNISRLAHDLHLWSTAEYGYIELSDGFCGTSSLMPQKKNPYALEYLSSEASQHAARVVHILTLLNAPSDEVALINLQKFTGSLWRGLDDAALSLKLMRGILETLKVNRKLMEERAGKHWAQAADLAGAMVRECGISWRSAHQIVGITVRKAIEQSRGPLDVTSELIDEAALDYLGRKLEVPADLVTRALDPWTSVQSRRLPGGPSPEVIKVELADHWTRLKRNQEHLKDITSKISHSKAKLYEAAHHIVESRDY